MLRWAIERSGIDAIDLAGRFPQLPEWEHGDSHPTLKQVERFAKATHTAIGFLFLQDPPIERVPIPDFRTIGDKKFERPSPDLLETLYICEQRQEWYRNFARSVGEEKRAFVGSVRIQNSVINVAANIRHALGFDLKERRQMHTWAEALRRFIEQADNLGILVMSSGVVLNNNRRKLKPDEFRGFTMADDLAPLIFINGADTKSAQMFTLAHELAHVWLGGSALSNADASAFPEHKTEQWCNEVAAELLVPIETFRSEYRKNAELRSETDRLARQFKVSTLVILRRIFDSGGISRERLWQEYKKEVQRLLAVPRGSGGDFYLTQSARVSKRFARALVASTLEGQTLHRDAFRMLGFSKLETFQELGRSLGVGI